MKRFLWSVSKNSVNAAYASWLPVSRMADATNRASYFNSATRSMVIVLHSTYTTPNLMSLSYWNSIFFS